LSELDPKRKIRSREDLAAELRDRRDRGERVVFTNGCFDLLHPGHIRYLCEAARLGDLLVVGLNSDRSVRTLKGPERPLVPQEERAEMLAALEAVDYVCVFDEDTPRELILQLRPDVLVKGGDYRREDLAGAAEIESWGGETVLAPLTEGKSTRGLIGEILRRYGRGEGGRNAGG